MEPKKEEIIILKNFREMVSNLELEDDDLEDMALLRWIRARDLDPKKAYQMLCDSLEWRKKYDIKNVLRWEPPANYSTDFEFYICGNDSEGRPVGIIPFGIWDLKSAIDANEKEIWLKYTDKLFATVTNKLKISSKEKGKPVTQYIIVFDFEGYSMQQLTSLKGVDSVIEVIRHFEANYPEFLYAAIVINAPLIFNILFNLVKPFLTARTMSKVAIYGSNPSKWTPVLLKNIPSKILPQCYGGEVPFQFKLKSAKEELQRQNDSFTKKIIPAGQKFEIDYEISQNNTVLKWSFRTDNHDIGFNVYFNDKENIVENKRYAGNKIKEGAHLCEKLGKYTLIFDNSYSKLRSKTLYYQISISNIE